MNPQPQHHPAPPSVAAQIAGLPDLPMEAIRALWRKLYGGDAPNHNRPFLVRRLAYRLQEVEFRKSDEQHVLTGNERRIRALLRHGSAARTDRDLDLMPGTVLTREFRDTTHQVLVNADGQYEFESRLYPSLSMIAREITGTRWSGPAFFGLKARAKPSTKGGRR